MEIKTKEKKKSVHIDPDLHRELKREALDANVDLQDLIDKKLRAKSKK